MPCMCGDIYCGSCGSAQGNYKCRQCGIWSSDGGCLDPDKCNALESAAIEAEAKADLRYPVIHTELCACEWCQDNGYVSHGNTD